MIVCVLYIKLLVKGIRIVDLYISRGREQQKVVPEASSASCTGGTFYHCLFIQSDVQPFIWQNGSPEN